MRILHLDCFSGISGNMLLGAFLDLGVDYHWLQDQLALMPLNDYQLQVHKVTKQGIAAQHVEITVPHKHDHRQLTDICHIINCSQLSDAVKRMAVKTFTILAEAEAKIHNCNVNDVHFHEVGALDAIIDIVGAALCFHKLAIKKVFSTALHVGCGTIKCAHGILPVPAPATAELLIGMPIYRTDIQGELVTPTGAAILTAFQPSFTPSVSFRSQAIGYGAGTKELSIPNVLRATIGDIAEVADMDLLNVLECNIDDLNPETYEFVMDRLFMSGALDVTLSPLIMKKSRPGTLLKVICASEHTAKLQQIIFTETSTLGLRIHEVKRLRLQRKQELVQTKYGPVRLKLSGMNGDVYTVAPEYEDCRQLALQLSVPLKQIYNAALSLYQQQTE